MIFICNVHFLFILEYTLIFFDFLFLFIGDFLWFVFGLRLKFVRFRRHILIFLNFRDAQEGVESIYFWKGVKMRDLARKVG